MVTTFECPLQLKGMFLVLLCMHYVVLSFGYLDNSAEFLMQMFYWGCLSMLIMVITGWTPNISSLSYNWSNYTVQYLAPDLDRNNRLFLLVFSLPDQIHQRLWLLVPGSCTVGHVQPWWRSFFCSDSWYFSGKSQLWFSESSYWLPSCCCIPE